MKPYLKEVNKSAEHSFLYKEDRFRYFPTPWHFHPEYEIIYVQESSGMRLIGDHIGNFQPGDLVLIGSGIPHTYINDKKYYQSKKIAATSLVIQFSESSAALTHFLDTPEMKEIRQLLEAASRSLEFTGKTTDEIGRLMKRFSTLHGSDRMMNLLSILQLMARDRRKKPLCSAGYRMNQQKNEFSKLGKALNYISEKFKEHISLEEAADKAGMQLQSFCRYFKKHTGKTFTQFVNDIRIGYACQRLQQTNDTIAAICFECGFENLSYFNRQFKKIKKQTPQQFRKIF